ncbi:MAG: lipid asymmetry maintenance ABC transporter permease subunit MlaE [Burkholderiaceae bacterium]|nr:lipid asymmetry maintenance ABC transporter permease subunit MlaE [Burkholderiaceae bacterium]
MKLLQPVADLGYYIRLFINALGRFARFLIVTLRTSSTAFWRPRLIGGQVHFIGNHSLSIIAVSGLFIGFVLSLQLYNLLTRYGSSELAGLAVNLALVRELGPVVTALLFAGRAGTSLTAEIGLMKSGEQLTALEMMAVDPMHRIVAPRFWGGFIAMPLLAAVFSFSGLMGAYLIIVGLVGLDAGAFWGQMQASVDWWLDIGQGVVKSLVFGTVVTAIALFEGYEAQPTPEGVSKATTRTVVAGSLAVLGLDFILTAFMFS